MFCDRCGIGTPGGPGVLHAVWQAVRAASDAGPGPYRGTRPVAWYFLAGAFGVPVDSSRVPSVNFPTGGAYFSAGRSGFCARAAESHRVCAAGGRRSRYRDGLGTSPAGHLGAHAGDRSRMREPGGHALRHGDRHLFVVGAVAGGFGRGISPHVASRLADRGMMDLTVRIPDNLAGRIGGRRRPVPARSGSARR